MRRVLIPVGTGLALRNVLRTGLPAAFERRGLSCVYAVPASVSEQLSAESGGAPFDVAPLPRIELPRAEVVLADLEFSIVHRRSRIATMDILLRERARHRERTPLKERIAPLLGTSWAAYRALRAMRLRLYRGAETASLLRAWSPAAVFANNVFHPAEAAVLRQAQHLGLPTVAMVHSWDNPSTKGALPVTPDRLLVWSDVTGEELRSYFRFPADRLAVVGSPQFDIYAHDSVVASREDLLAEYGFDPSTRIVLYATAAPGHCPSEPGYAEIVARLLERTHDRGPLGLVVRLHPRDRLDRWSALAGRDHVRIEAAGRRGSGVEDSFNPTDDDHLHFAALIRHADVVVNVASTVALDAAANDTPGVHVGFDLDDDLDYLDSVTRFFDYTHTSRLIAYGAAPLTRSPDELCTEILRALDDPGARAAERRALAAAEGVDGRGESADRIADAVADATARGR